ncbi:MAG: PQQ-dependent sugar dehydrogenase [Alphaproteobacteria bacterium]|nr:PQQ-dependent sugar dehydrogenase [Alphaproteobacteria bacterium]
MQKYLSKRNIIITIAISFILLLIVTVSAYRHIANNIAFHSIATVLYQKNKGDESFKEKVKVFLQETVFVFRNQELLKKEILENPTFVEYFDVYQAIKTIRGRKDFIQQWAAIYLKQNGSEFHVSFQKNKTAKQTINDKIYQLDYFSAELFTTELNEYARIIYLHYDDNQLFFITGEGILGSIDLTEQTINDNQLDASVIASNLEEFTDPTFSEYDNNIRDLFIKNGKIYVSQNIAFNPKCYGTILLAGTVNTKKIEFKQIFAPDECDQNHFKNQQTEFFLIDYSISGGRIADYKDDKILLSTGDTQRQAQGNNTHGKIFAIDETTYSRDIISNGHRNPQGLYYNKQENLILSTEHGAYGGDEINLNKTPGNDVENFGWPIASYSFEYGFNPETDVNVFKTSHQEHGFVEPLHHYTPAIAPSQIIQVSEKFNNIVQKQMLLAALTGSDPHPQSGGNGITHFILNDDYSIKEKEVFELDGRIRDLIYVETLNVVIAYHEDAKSILIIKAINQ